MYINDDENEDEDEVTLNHDINCFDANYNNDFVIQFFKRFNSSVITRTCWRISSVSAVPLKKVLTAVPMAETHP